MHINIIKLFILFGILKIAACGDKEALQKAGKSDNSAQVVQEVSVRGDQAAEAKAEPKKPIYYNVKMVKNNQFNLAGGMK